MLFRKRNDPQPPAHFADAPAEFSDYWRELSDPARIRREMAALLLAEMRASGPAWPTERFQILASLLEKQP